MQKEIGSIFSSATDEIEVIEQSSRHDRFYFFSLCREALLCIASNYVSARKVILIPAYTCQTVIEPFIQEHWDVHLYPIDTRLCIRETEFLTLLDKYSPSAVLVHPYYGKRLLEYEANLLKKAKRHGALIIQDLTQSVFSLRDEDYIDITVGSLRKWMAIPDGSFLFIHSHVRFDVPEVKQYNMEFVIPQLDAMYLRGEYFRTDIPSYKQISIRLNKYAEGLTVSSEIRQHRISDYSLNELKKTDFDLIYKKRMDNFETLLLSVRQSDKCMPVIGSIEELDGAPLYFPVYVRERDEFQKQLAINSIYAPVLWGTESSTHYIDSTIEYIFRHILAIPIDQRYDEDDMLRIADNINAICDS